MRDERLEAEILAGIRAKRAALMICDRAKTGQCESGNCHWQRPHVGEQLPKDLVCRTVPVKFVQVGYPRHCLKCDRREAACRCEVPELVENQREGKTW